MPWKPESRRAAYREHIKNPNVHPWMYTRKYATLEERYAAQSKWQKETNHIRHCHTPEAEAKSLATRIKNGSMKCTEAQKKILSEKLKGRKPSPETIENMRASAKNRSDKDKVAQRALERNMGRF